METSFETLIGLMAAMVLFALVLIVYLVRAWRKGEPRETPTTAPDEQLSAKADAAEPAPYDRADRSEASIAPAAPAAPESRGPTPPPAQAAPVPGAETAREPGVTPLMQVWQDPEGVLIIEVEGRRYRHLFEIQDGGIGRRVLDTINRLVAFSRGQEPRAVSPSAPRTAAPTPADVGPSVEGVVEARSQDFVDRLRQKSDTQPLKSRLSADPVPFRRRSEAQQTGITLNLADEIDQLLQVRVQASSTFSQRYIHVTSTPDGGINFDVDGTRYGTLDELPDPQIVALIRAAIADWEARR
jgi:hypothetical protein